MGPSTYTNPPIAAQWRHRLLWPLVALVVVVVACVAPVATISGGRTQLDAMCPRLVHRVFEDSVPIGYLKAGNYTDVHVDAGSAASPEMRLPDCVNSCCAAAEEPSQCNVAFMVGAKCYHVQCISNALCMPHRRAANASGSGGGGGGEADAAEQSAADEAGKMVPRMVLVRPVAGDGDWLATLKRTNPSLVDQLDAEQFDDQSAAAAAASDPADQPLMYSDIMSPLGYAEKSGEDASGGAGDSLGGIYRGFTNAEPASLYGGPSAAGDDLQMDADQLFGTQLQSCLIGSAEAAKDARKASSSGLCVGQNERCVAVSRESALGVCDCVPGYQRSPRGDCVRRLVAALMNDLVAAVADEMPSSRIAPEAAAAAASEAPTTSTTTTSAAPTTGRTLTVSVLSKDVRLPEREVTLSAYTISDSINGNASQYRYLWSLISKPDADVNGTMSDQTKDTIRLTNLSEGLYRFKVVVTAGSVDANTTGEAYANVTVSPQKRINRAPQVIITPDAQTVKLPTTQAILDGSTSTDDDRIETWHWDLIQGPIGYHPQLPEVATLQLADLTAPGNYTFRLTLTDSDGAHNSSTAQVAVLKANDYPPEANAGSDVILYLPDNNVTLDGSLSTDDREIVSWEWTKDSSVESKAVDMQNTRTPHLKLSNLQEGIYAFELRVGDASNQTSTAKVHVFVKPAPANRRPQAQAGAGNVTISLPRTWVQLNGSAVGAVQAARFEWSQVQGPNRAQLEAPSNATGNATGLTVGVYGFRLTVWSDGGLNDTADVWVTVVQETNVPPVANAGGDQTIVAPVRNIVLNGSASSDDLGIVEWEWTAAGSSLAVGGVVVGRTNQEAVLILTDIHPGRYVYELRVTDAQGATSVDTASIIVHPDPLQLHLVELSLAVAVQRWTQDELRTMLDRLQLLLSNEVSTNVTVQEKRVDRKSGELVLVFFASRKRSGVTGAEATESLPMAGHDVERLLAQRFWHEPDLLGTIVTDVRTTVCQNMCSGHGVCEPITRACDCDAFWMPDAFWLAGVAEANCNWSILYVVIAIFVVFLCLVTCCWGLLRLCKRNATSVVKKTLTRKRAKLQKYSPLGTQDDEIPTLSQSNATTLSESDTDSDVVFESSRSNSKSSLASRKLDIETGPSRSGQKSGRNGSSRLGRKLRT